MQFFVAGIDWCVLFQNEAPASNGNGTDAARRTIREHVNVRCDGPAVAGQGTVHIKIIGARGAVDSRTRAYVEYRVFDTLRSVEREIRSVDVSLSEPSVNLPRLVTCRVALEFTTGQRLTAVATAEWPYAAVDRAVNETWRHVSARSEGGRATRGDTAESNAAI